MNFDEHHNLSIINSLAQNYVNKPMTCNWYIANQSTTIFGYAFP